jgi:hypothetical protein
MKKTAIVFLFLAAALGICSRAQAQVLVIASPGVKATSIAKSDLRDLFTGAATSMPDGSRVVPILLKAGTAHEEFLKAYIGKNDSAYQAGWRSLVFSGQASMPKTLDSDAAVVDFVAHNPNVIAYIGSGSPHEGIKVLAIK